MTWQIAFQTPNRVGESPFWHSKEQQLYWVDIESHLVCRGNPQTHQWESWEMPSEPGCIVPCRSGGLIIALRDGLYHAAHWKSPLRLWHMGLHDPKALRFNDGKCDAQGRFWIGTRDEEKQNRAALYRLTHSHLEVMAEHMQTVNGIDFALEGKTIYCSNTPAHTIYTSSLTENPLALQTWAHFDPPGRPDGAAIDSQGAYWVALFEGKRIVRLASDSSLLAEIETPTTYPTMVCFGEDDYKTLYLTTAQPKTNTEPQAGYIFSLRVDVPGRMAFCFNDL